MAVRLVRLPDQVKYCMVAELGGSWARPPDLSQGVLLRDEVGVTARCNLELLDTLAHTLDGITAPGSYEHMRRLELHPE